MIRKQDLGRLERIAEGAVGVVYKLLDFTLPGQPTLAYKELKPADSQFTPDKRQQALDAMQRSVHFRERLSPANRADLDEVSTWPIGMVEDRGDPCGLVMPLLPAEFFLTANPPGGSPHELVFELSWLCAKDSQTQTVGIDRSAVSDPLVRIALLARLVYAVGRLHKHGAVYGDLSLKNAALAVNPLRVKLLDCDAVAALSDRNRVQMHSPFFQPPEHQTDKNRLQDHRTDVFKLALCIIRGLQQGPGVTQAKDPNALATMLDAPAVDLLVRAVGADPAARPTAKELFDCLDQNLQAKAAPPLLRSARLNRQVVPRGSDVEVIWEATGAKAILIQGPNGFTHTLPDPGTTPASWQFKPTNSGEITVEVRNGHGSARAVAREVMLFTLPPFEQLDLTGKLPVPEFARPPDVEVPTLRHDFPPIPTTGAADHRPPAIAVPSLAPVTDLLAAVQDVVEPIAGLAEHHSLMFDAAEAVRRAVDPGLTGAPLGAATASVAAGARAVLDHAWEQLRDRTEQEVRDMRDRRAAQP
jgi:hypothetical protein